MLVVVGLGGNALLRRGQPLTAESQIQNVRRAAIALANLAQEHQLVVTHGNGPQVGLLALQAEAYPAVPPYPLDMLGAETEGLIGYLIEQELRNQLPDQAMVTLLTQIEVDPNDPAFQTPSKFIGPQYSKSEAQQLSAERGYTIAPDGKAYRRVVPSPKPKVILELSVIQQLVQAEILVICAGGGGIPVSRHRSGHLYGVEGVIDKDLATALLAIELEAEALLLLTDVEAVYTHWGQPTAQRIDQVSHTQLDPEAFAPGSIGPKIAAACQFVAQTGHPAGIGNLEQAVGILRGQGGTRIV
ncbi:carbamate kinase [Lyngbya confervoides]|uniref:Carbamate kinase n=1 Tax=Lyngbya confervoides BDU141951 TaxID=1574623 RepID=A0ABD4T4T4_9CYAN|nr:carbamate kinase [Lyngbya confervoides]MCM1983513.1 carbamate kinase [Lyngbya confervoides BDU141951]